MSIPTMKHNKLSKGKLARLQYKERKEVFGRQKLDLYNTYWFWYFSRNAT